MIYIWSVSTLTHTKRLDCSDDVLCLKLLPNGFLASGLAGSSILLWNLASGNKIATLTGHISSVLSLEVLPNRDLASGANDNSIKVWDINTHLHKYNLNNHGGAVNALKLLPNGFLASCSSDQSVKVWDTTNQKEVGQLDANKPLYSLELLGKKN